MLGADGAAVGRPGPYRGHLNFIVVDGRRFVRSGRRCAGCPSLVTDGSWLWRQDFAHCLDAHHVVLPEEFLRHVRGLDYRMPALVGAGFAPHYNETMPLVGWASAIPWESTEEITEPEFGSVGPWRSHQP
jgi:hypothetical protein